MDVIPTGHSFKIRVIETAIVCETMSQKTDVGSLLIDLPKLRKYIV